MNPRLAIPAIALLAAACGDQTEVPDDNLVPENQEAEVAREALPQGDFAELELGAKVAEDVTTRLANETGAFADMRSYVACPAGMTVCDPATAPEGTVYTYVHVVYPGEDNNPATGSGDGNDASNVETTEAFRMTMPSHGFTGAAGISYAEVNAALGDVGMVVLSCHEGSLAWTIEEGDGGDQWSQGEPITFYWQSTLPPSGSADAYEVFANYTAAHGSGPYPGAAGAATNACAAPSSTDTSTAG